MLIGIPPLISPDLLLALYKMGHGDEIILADAHFPGERIARENNLQIIRADGITVDQLLQAILPLFPLDTFIASGPLFMMQKVPGDTTDMAPTLQRYSKAIEIGCQNKRSYPEDLPNPKIEEVERFGFYERASKAYAIVMTGETAKYGNIGLKKGVTPI